MSVNGLMISVESGAVGGDAGEGVRDDEDEGRNVGARKEETYPSYLNAMR